MKSAPAPPLSARRRRRQRQALLIYGAVLAVLFLVLAEGLVRLRGFRPYRLAPLSTRIEPGGRLFAPHPTLGYAHLPGEFKVTLADGYLFRLTHLTNSLRATHRPRPAEPARKPLWIMGCSMTHGWSLNDEETYPWRLQEALPDWEVHNFGVNGYGTLHSLLQYREHLKTQPKPVVVVVAYASFHDERNTCLRSWRKAIVPYNLLGPLAPPFARLDSAGRLVIRQQPAQYTEWPLQRVSALAHFLERQYNERENHFVHSHAVSLALLEQFAAECRTNSVTFVLAGITRGQLTADTLEFGRRQGLRVVDISVSLSEPGSRNLPHDDHPSARSNEQYAQTLAAFLRTL